MNSNKILFILVVVLLIAVAALLLFKNESPTYHAVYLDTGDIYFGKLSYFPQYGMNDPYLLQLTQNRETPVSVQRFKDVFWGPDGFLKLNREKVVWTAKLSSKGELAKILADNPNLIPNIQNNPISTPQENEGNPDESVPTE